MTSGSARAPAPERRSTRQRAAVQDALASGSGFVTAQELHAALRGAGDGVGLATVYRALSALAADGLVDVLRTDDGQTRYRACTQAAHHHHLVCRDCADTVEIQADAIETWAARAAADHGYRDVTHTVEVFGRCPACATT